MSIIDFVNLDYIDSFMIVDNHFKVVFTRRYNPRHGNTNQLNDYSDYMDKNYFEVYPKLKQQDSTMFECLKKGHIVYRKQQYFQDYNGQVFNTRNVTIPINRGGEIVAAIELSKDLTSVHDLSKDMKESSEFDDFSAFFCEDSITFDNILTTDLTMIENIRRAKIFAQSSSPTLIYGETGTGKELFVQSMVNYCTRPRSKFIAHNCGAVPGNLMESILFGSVKGAYTGAENKTGLFELADGGILFLDEFNSLAYELQSKLLRVLQNGKIRPIGSGFEKMVDVKVIVAMNTDPLDAIEKNLLREDLFYRLSSGTIKLIPLRERTQDIILYINHFIKVFNQRYLKKVEGLSGEMMEFLIKYPWPGNVRELKHIMESMISLSEGRILTLDNLPIYMKDRIDMYAEDMQSPSPVVQEQTFSPLKHVLEKAEHDEIRKALRHTNGHINHAAEKLQIPRQTLRRRMKKLNIEPAEYKR